MATILKNKHSEITLEAVSLSQGSNQLLSASLQDVDLSLIEHRIALKHHIDTLESLLAMAIQAYES